MLRLRERLQLSPRSEFKFHADSHRRRLEVLEVLGHQPLSVSTVTLDKVAVLETHRPIGRTTTLYSEMCGIAIAQPGPHWRVLES